MGEKFNWAQFLKTAGGVFLIGLGGSIIATQKGSLSTLILAFSAIAIGLAIIFSD